MLPIRGRRAWSFRAVAIPLAALLASHFILYRRFPGQPGYEFPLSNFLFISLITLACWEVNLWVFRRLDTVSPFYRHPIRRIGQQMIAGGLATALTFAVSLLILSALVFRKLPGLPAFGIGLFIAFVIASIINGVYVGLYLIGIIDSQQNQTADQLNEQLALSATTPPEKPITTGILIETGTQLLQLQPAEVAYVYSAGGLVQLIRTDGRKLTTNYDSLNPLMERLPAGQFFQINRQFIVNLSAVRLVKDETNRKLAITLTPDTCVLNLDRTEPIMISRYRSTEFRKWLTEATKPA